MKQSPNMGKRLQFFVKDIEEKHVMDSFKKAK